MLTHFIVDVKGHQFKCIMKLTKQIAEELEKRRKELGIPKCRLAQMSGLTRPSVYRVLDGQGNITICSLEQLLEALKLEIKVIKK